MRTSRHVREVGRIQLAREIVTVALPHGAPRRAFAHFFLFLLSDERALVRARAVLIDSQRRETPSEVFPHGLCGNMARRYRPRRPFRFDPGDEAEPRNTN